MHTPTQPQATTTDPSAELPDPSAELPDPRHPRELPDDGGQLARAATALFSDLAGIALATVGRAAGWIGVPVEAASLVTMVDTQPRLRGLLERALGPDRADTALAVTNAAAQGLARSRVGLVVDAAVRAAQLSEARARHEAGIRAHPTGPAEEVRCDPPAVARRPRPMPDGAVERYAPRSAKAAAAGAVVSLASGTGPGHAAAIAVSTLSKAPAAGREMFAARLGRSLARRGAQVIDHRVLRLLDRVDTVVLDASALNTGRRIVTDVVALSGVDPEQAQVRVHAMFDSDPATDLVEEGNWRLGPIERLDLVGDTAARQRARLLGAAQGIPTTVLGLAEERRLHAVVATRSQPADSVDALVAAARRAGADLVFAGGRPHGSRAVEATDLPGGDRLVETVRQLQCQGHVVLLVSANAQALASADGGIGLAGVDGAQPWGAHILAGTNLEIPAILIEATAVARTVCRRGIILSEAGSAIGAVGTLTRAGSQPAGRALLAVNAAAALSLAQGAWSAAELDRRPLAPPVSSVAWHLLPVPKALSDLKSRAEGLSTRDAKTRRRSEAADTPESAGIGRAMVEELANPLTPILAGGAALSAAIGSVVDAGIIVGASILGAIVGAAQRTSTSRTLADLLARSAVMTTVRRDGDLVRIRADAVVAGDVVVLNPNDVVPADCRLTEASGLELDESSLTGESLPVSKSTAPVAASAIADRTSMVYEGTTVAAGRGAAVVVATGAATEAGRGVATARESAPVSGVETRLAQISGATLPIALGSGVAVMAAGLVRGLPPRRTIGAGVGLAVASVPEGLPFLVSAAQLAAARRLSQHGALVRNARTIEALGRVDVLCFDKTGTLTQGTIKLAVVSDGVAASPVETLTDWQRIVLSAALRATPVPRPGQRLPHHTDRAVVLAAQTLEIPIHLNAPGWRRTQVIPFEPSRGYHMTIGTTGDTSLLSIKGAPEILLPRCVTRLTPAGDQPLNPRMRRRLRDELHRLAGMGYRVLAVAESAVPEETPLPEETPTGLRFLGFLALADPIRASAGASLEELRGAGAQIVVITGDHPRTAETIADELGLVNGHKIVTGSDIDALDDDALTELVPHIAVVARSTPAHKVRVVRAFQRAGRVVAMTGDGANDAPAIRLADVGIALGRRGTPAARAAADLVVTDDRLETIIAAIVEGRTMWKSVRESLGILVGGNLGEIGFTVLGALLTGASPLSARQLLLMNLLTDLAPALALALRPPPAASTESLAEGPEQSLGDALTREMALRAAATAAGASLGWMTARVIGPERWARTVALAALVGTQLAQTLLLGRASPSVLGASIGSAAVLAAVIQIPGVSQFFGCTPLGPLGWAIAASAAAGTAFAFALPAVRRYAIES